MNLGHRGADGKSTVRQADECAPASATRSWLTGRVGRVLRARGLARRPRRASTQKGDWVCRRAADSGNRLRARAWPGRCNRCDRPWRRTDCHRGPSFRPGDPWRAVGQGCGRGGGRSTASRAGRRANTGPACRNTSSRSSTRRGPSRDRASRRPPRCWRGRARRYRGTGGRPRPRPSSWP